MTGTDSKDVTHSTPPTPGIAQMSGKPARRVSYVHSNELQRVGDALPSNVGRASLVHSLISSHGLLDDGEGEDEGNATRGYNRATIVAPARATREELLSFHDDELIGPMAPSLFPQTISCPDTSCIQTACSAR